MPIKDPENTLIMETTKGKVVIALRPDLAPKHVERIKKLAREGFYDGIVFHRVIDGFMAQTGCPQGTGTGGSKYPNLPSEFSRTPFKRGVVGMARKGGDNNSANSQFFIMYADGPSLNGEYTVIGEVVSGMDVVDKIKKGEPVVDPDRGSGFLGLREREPGARRALLVHQPAVPRIGDRRVGEQDLPWAEGAGIVLPDAGPRSEERDLEADRSVEPAGSAGARRRR